LEKQKIIDKQDIIQFIKFTVFSAGAGIVQVISFTILYEIVHFLYWPSYLIALVLSVLCNFTINRKFTFKSASNVPVAMLKVLGYYSIFTPLSTWWGIELTSLGWNEYLILAGTMIINFVTEFLFTKFVVFRDSYNTNRLA
jgi:putative flippase GtrA